MTWTSLTPALWLVSIGLSRSNLDGDDDDSDGIGDDSGDGGDNNECGDWNRSSCD